MGQETVLFKSEERKDLHSVVDFLRQLADKLAQNEVILLQGGNKLKLSVPNQVVLELKVEAEVKHNSSKRSLEIEIEWSEGQTDTGGTSLG